MKKFTNFLKKEATIGLVAPSFGANIEPYKTRLTYALKLFKKMGYKIKTFGDLYGYQEGASETKEKRAKHFMACYLDSEVDVIFSVSGGELLMEILPLLDFEIINAAPVKLFCGYSDNTNLTFVLTTMLNIPTVYGPTFTNFGMKPLNPFLKRTLQILSGNFIKQNSSSYYEPRDYQNTDPLASYNLTLKTKWRNLNEEKEIRLEGILIGGCLDVLIGLVGTKYDDVKNFLKQHQKEKIIWYLESFDLNSLKFKRALWQLKEAGWFERIDGLLIGRHLNEEAALGITHDDVLKELFNIPVIVDLDIGHVKPMLTIINGYKALIVNNENESYYQILK